ncbi:MAG: restriction endonuclease subunit S [Candidatus Poribacteria bacterium]|nr:restriction endonuclease subunit S [Candidatus Poribacteria bacterium]
MSTHHPHIPNWKTVKLGEVTEIIKGGTPSRNVEKYFRGNIAWAIPSDITALDSFLYIDDTETHITEEALSNSAARLLPAGTVLLTSRATIGDTAIATAPMATNQGFANFVCEEKLLNVFLAYYLRYIRGKLNDLASGSTFKEVTKGTLLNIEIPCLPFEEQRAIAEVLSDVDGLLNALEALIAKKLAIKQAVMQQLLTGKTRLPGFSGAWQEMRIGDLFGVKAGGDLVQSKYSDVQDNRYSYPIYANALEQQGLYGFSNYAEEPAESITVTARGTLGQAFYRDTPFVAIGRLLVLKPKVLLDARFFCEYINYGIYFAIESTGVPQLTAPQISRYLLPVPSQSEQHAITSVLSDMDAEIAALEQRRDKTHAIKQGMMQQLLTGRVRLSESRICTDLSDDAD